MQDFGDVLTRPDGSYVITYNDLPYHVPCGGDLADLWAQVNAYAVAHPEMVTAEPVPPPLTPEDELASLQKAFTDAIQGHLDAFAQTRNYDGIMSAATYATSAVPKFRAEGQYAVEARDATWAKGYEIMDAVLSGQRPMPGLDDVIAELPPLVWPEVPEV